MFLIYASVTSSEFLHSLLPVFVQNKHIDRILHRFKIFINRLKVILPRSDNLVPKGVHLRTEMRDQLFNDLIQVIIALGVHR